jgi:hypothetical protein
MKSGYLIFFLFLLFIDAYCLEDKLRYVFAFSRNGARSPLKLDIEGEDMFGEEWLDEEDVTAVGLQMEYVNGAKLKRHYIDRLQYLSKKFDSRQLKIRTADFSSSLLTSYTQLMSMYPATTGPRLIPEQIKNSLPPYDLYYSEKVLETLGFSALPHNGQVFPVKTFPAENNYFGLTDPKVCVGVKDIIKQNQNKTIIYEAMTNFTKNHFKNLKIILNLTDNFFYNYDNIYNFCDTLMSGIVNKRNFTLFKKNNINDTYIYKTLYKDCNHFLMLDLYEVKLSDKDNKIVRYSMSNLIRKLCHKLDQIMIHDNWNMTLDTEKFLMYTGHETEIAAFLVYLNITINTKLYFPKYGSTLILEFIRTKNAPQYATTADYLINIYLNENALIKMRYRDFKMNVLPLTVDNKPINIWCGFDDNSGLYFFIAACVLFFFACVIGIWIYYLIQKQKKEQENVEEENNNEENLNNEGKASE